jgi:hypothetical protein
MPTVVLVRTPVRLKSREGLQSFSRFLDLLGMRCASKWETAAGSGAGYESSTGQLELFAPAPNSKWSPFGDADLHIRVGDSEAVYGAVKDNGFNVVFDSHDPEIRQFVMEHAPRGISADELEDYKRAAASSKRSFMVKVADIIIFVDGN